MRMSFMANRKTISVGWGNKRGCQIIITKTA